MLKTMKAGFPVVILVLLTMGRASANLCADYRRVLSYSRTFDPTPVTLMLDEEKTKAEITLRVPRNYTAIHGNLTDGAQCKIALELTWPDMTPGGLVPDDQKRVRDRMMGDVSTWRALTIDVRIEHAAWLPWSVPGGYCDARERLTELAERPFGLRGFDDQRSWPHHRQANGTYRTMQELVAYPLDAANVFYAIDEPAVENMVRISCSKGAPRCRLESNFHGFRTTTLFNADDLENWRSYRDMVRDFLSRHLVGSVPAQAMPNPGYRRGSSATLVACMRDMAAKGSIDPAILRRMGLDR